MIKRLLTLGTLISSINILVPIESKAKSVWIPIDNETNNLVYYVDVTSITRKGDFSFYNMCATGRAGRETWRLEDCDERKTGQQVNCKNKTRFWIGGGKEKPQWNRHINERTLNLVCN